jgi:hypothetical protein
VPTFEDRGCHVISVTDPHGRILGFLDRNNDNNHHHHHHHHPIQFPYSLTWRAEEQVANYRQRECKQETSKEKAIG